MSEVVVKTFDPRIVRVGLCHPDIKLRVNGTDHAVKSARIGKYGRLLEVEGFEAHVGSDDLADLIASLSAELDALFNA